MAHPNHSSNPGAGEWELLYKGKGSDHETPEFIVRIEHPELLDQWKGDPNKVPIVEIVDSPEVFVTEHGRHIGKLARPTKGQLLGAFGSDNFDEIFAFMAHHGHLQNAGKHSDFRMHEIPKYRQQHA